MFYIILDWMDINILSQNEQSFIHGVDSSKQYEILVFKPYNGQNIENSLNLINGIHIDILYH